jgi:hypothetical protein
MVDSSGRSHLRGVAPPLGLRAGSLHSLQRTGLEGASRAGPLHRTQVTEQFGRQGPGSTAFFARHANNGPRGVPGRRLGAPPANDTSGPFARSSHCAGVDAAPSFRGRANVRLPVPLLRFRDRGDPLDDRGGSERL